MGQIIYIKIISRMEILMLQIVCSLFRLTF